MIGPGDTLAVLAARYGTTVESLRQVNPELQDLKTIAAAKGDSLYGLAGRYGTSTGALRQDNPALMQSDPYLVAEGDTIANLASRQQETVSALRLFNPLLSRYPASAPLPAGVTIQLPAIGVADALAVGLPLLVPQVEPGDPLPMGGGGAVAAPGGGGGVGGVIGGEAVPARSAAAASSFLAVTGLGGYGSGFRDGY